MRELVDQEVEQVGGGVLNLGTGALAAAAGGMLNGAIYALNSSAKGEEFACSEFSGEVAAGALTGFMLGTGASLVVAGASAALPGAVVAGVTSMGTGAAFGAAYWVDPRPMPH